MSSISPFWQSVRMGWCHFVSVLQPSYLTVVNVWIKYRLILSLLQPRDSEELCFKTCSYIKCDRWCRVASSCSDFTHTHTHTSTHCSSARRTNSKCEQVFVPPLRWLQSLCDARLSVPPARERGGAHCYNHWRNVGYCGGNLSILYALWVERLGGGYADGINLEVKGTRHVWLLE